MNNKFRALGQTLLLVKRAIEARDRYDRSNNTTDPDCYELREINEAIYKEWSFLSDLAYDTAAAVSDEPLSHWYEWDGSGDVKWQTQTLETLYQTILDLHKTEQMRGSDE